MALYEIVLRRADGTDEVRVTDRRPAVGDTLRIGNRSWEVVLERDPADFRAAAQFLCELTREQRGRALAAREQDAAMRRRMDARVVPRSRVRDAQRSR